jgi:hypothetical protein
LDVNAFGGSAAVASIRVVKERSEGLASAAAELYAHGDPLALDDMDPASIVYLETLGRRADVGATPGPR